ncbi:MAG TPA: methyltransferase domain-containing protein [Candidatus Methanoperedenaceae archaeon]|nr:methyltransferase domain-containing protein [Candidatus Methanoperedenaceae archaeon]
MSSVRSKVKTQAPASGEFELDQHFIIDPGVAEKLVDAAQISKDDTVLEVGAGTGNVTAMLAEKAKKVYAIEKSPRFLPMLMNIKGNIEVIQGNAVDIEFPVFDRLVSNVPFSISEALIQKLIRYDFRLASLILPGGFVKRLLAQKGDAEYSLLSLKSSLFFDIEVVGRLEKKAFDPEPRVVPWIIRLQPKQKSNIELILRCMVCRPGSKVKNSLREAVTEMLHVTKNEARARLASLPADLADRRVYTLSLDDVERIMESLEHEQG